jgi:hypothetical protein
VLNGDHTPNDHPALLGPHIGPGIYPRELTGCTLGIQQGELPHVVCFPVIDENTGYHSSIFKPSPKGYQKAVGSDPGASGAQLSGPPIFPSPNQPQVFSIASSNFSLIV